MKYAYTAIPDSAIPCAANPLLQHMLDTYVSETNKVVSVWRAFHDSDLDYKPHPKSTTVVELFKHQLLSERRFFAAFLQAPEVPPEEVLPEVISTSGAISRFVELVRKRLAFLAAQQDGWWLEVVPFFDVKRPRIWIFWRRVLHTAHHRTQMTVYLRMLNREVPSTYGPTSDVTWEQADPTQTVAAAGRTTFQG